MCYFVIYIDDKQPLHVEEICIDKNFWESQMLPKLCSFYEDHLLRAIAQQ